jgi:hypothetical protein
MSGRTEGGAKGHRTGRTFITTMTFEQVLSKTPDWASRHVSRPRGAQPRQRRTGVSEKKIHERVRAAAGGLKCG